MWLNRHSGGTKPDTRPLFQGSLGRNSMYTFDCSKLNSTRNETPYDTQQRTLILAKNLENGASFGDCQEIPLIDESLGTSDIFELGMILDGSHPAWLKIPQGWKGDGSRAMIDDVIKQVEHGLLQMVGFIGLQSQTAHCS
jgi:hypothetical protein